MVIGAAFLRRQLWADARQISLILVVDSSGIGGEQKLAYDREEGAMCSRRLAKARRFERLESRCLLSVGDPYIVPTNPRVTQNLDAAWKFQLNPPGSPQSSGYDDSTWSSINLPYTWDGSTTNAPLGNGWYRKTITIDSSLIGKELYLEFGGAYLVTSLFIDGTQADYNPTVVGIDSHNGGFAEFDFDITAQLTAGTHVVAVQVNNNTNSNIEPAGGGDYTKQGGIYRDVSLVAINKAAHLAPIESAPGTNTPVATPGVYFSNSNVTIGIATANIQVVSEIDNLSPSASSVTITSYLVDSAGIIQAQTTSTQSLAAGQRSVAVTQSASVANPHLWDGRIDPYLYTLFDEVRDSGTNTLLDLSQQQVGIRSFKINAQPNATDADPTNDAAFMLNGHPYQLVGVNVHQDTGEPGQLGAPAGWAETDAEVQNDINLVLQTGATLVRTAHYEHSQAQFNYFDQVGLLVIAEGGINGTITSTTPGTAFVNNADDQLTELIKQNYNHPSIFAWSLYNEVSNSAAKGSLMSSLSNLAHSLDATGRYTDAENNSGSITDAVDAAADINGQHLYSGWYGGSPTQNGSQLDSMHNSSPTRPLGVTEFGGGASPWQFTNNIQLSPPTPNGEHFHPANSQTQLEELMYSQWASRNYLWGIALWTMFDFSSSGRNEGDTQGQNDKGLITARPANQERQLLFLSSELERSKPRLGQPKSAAHFRP